MNDADRQRVRRYVARLDEKRRTLESEIEETVALGRGLTPEEHDRDSRAVIEAGWRMLEAREDFERVVHLEEPPAPDFRQLWRRLVEARREGRACPRPPST